MELPASVAALGEQLGGTGDIVPDPALFKEPDVFAAERERVFARPWTAVDHQTRLPEHGHYFVFDAANRSVVVTRDSEGCLHALRNLCLHAGYPICDAEDGSGERLICPYHGWEYTLTGRLVEPELSSRIDPARLQLARYRVSVRDGLIFADLSGGSAPAEEVPVRVPNWLADSAVTRRARYSTTSNWKFVLHLARSNPDLFLDGPPEADDSGRCIEFGPLSLMMVSQQQAALVRVIPKFAERTDVQLIQMAAAEAPERTATGEDAIAAALGCAGGSSGLDRGFFDWYWPLMSGA